jgi:L-threonylcarbamoyladenylate synthase
MLYPITDDNLARAITRLKTGELVAFPTETVYGLGADARNDKAVAKIYAAKGRPRFNPLIAHVTGQAMAEDYAALNDHARLLMDIFWPGALTLILPIKQNASLSSLATAGLKTIGLRAPDHKIALHLIAGCGFPIVAPSANRSGGLSPTTAMHVEESLGEKAGMILAGGKTTIGLESTIIDLSGAEPCLLRYGGVTLDEIENVIGKVELKIHAEGGAVTSPGQLLQHYAPQKPLRLNAVDVEKDEALLAFGAARFMGVKGGGALKSQPDGYVQNLSETGDLLEAAANLFHMLHLLDKTDAKRIAVMAIPKQGLGLAINDRLARGAIK